jgi:hypothetical protein
VLTSSVVIIEKRKAFAALIVLHIRLTDNVCMESMKNPHQAQDYFILPEDDRPRKEPTIKLTPEQIDFFKTNGFLSIDQLIDEKEVAYIRDQYDQVYLFIL